MPARKKTPRTRKPRSRSASQRRPLDRPAAALPTGLRHLVQQLQRGLRQLEQPLAKGRAERGRSFEERQHRMRRSLAGLLRRLERAIDPGPRAPGRRKAASRREATAGPAGDAGGD